MTSLRSRRVLPLSLAAVLFADWLVGCGSRPTAATCRTDSDCHAGSWCNGGLCEVDLVISFASPSGAVATNGVLSIQVQVSGSSPATVELMVDASFIAAVPPPYSYSWDTAGLSEGQHELWARVYAGSETFESGRIAITVDRTPPRLARNASSELLVVPRSGATNVWSRDAITITFDEPMRATSATDATVLLTDQSGIGLAKSLSLSVDGTMLTVTPGSLPAVPNELTLTVTSALTDLAGNRLVDAPAPWTWYLPVWQEPSALVWEVGNGSNYFLAVDRLGRPTVAGTDFSTSAHTIVVRRWSGSAWVSLPAPTTVTDATLYALDVDSDGLPAVAWREGSGRDLHAARWDGAVWVGASTVLATGYYGGPLPLRYEPTGASRRPVVAFYDADAGGAIRAWVLDGTTWSSLGGGTGSPYGSRLELGFDGAGALRLFWLDQRTSPSTETYLVSRLRDGTSGAWSGTEWSLPEPIAAGAAMAGEQCGGSIQIDPSGRPVVGWADASSPRQLHVSRYDPVKTQFELVGSDATLNSDPTKNVRQGGCSGVALALDSSGEPVVAWGETFASGSALPALHAKWWLDPAWYALGDNLFSTGDLWVPCGPRIAMGADGVVAVAWWESYAGVKVKRYNR